MVKVLICGANGYIGLPLAQSLRRDGHTVWGLTRTVEKAKILLQNEIIPIIGTVEGGESLGAIRRNNIDIVVDAASADQGSSVLLEGLKRAASNRLKMRGPHGPRIGYVYVSGTWVHGTSDRPVNDLNPVGVRSDQGCLAEPPSIFAWRLEFERAILDARDLVESVIVRPALIYGGAGTTWSLWFDPMAASEGNPEVKLAAIASAMMALVHIDDAVSALHLAVTKHSLVSTSSGTYPVFDLSSSCEPLESLLTEAAKAFKFKGRLLFEGPGDYAFAQAMNTSARVSSTRARDLLGWSPKHTSMVEEMETFVAAWKAHHIP